MPACTALGVKSSTSVASSFGRGLVPVEPQPASSTSPISKIARVRIARELMCISSLTFTAVRRRVTFSRNYTLSLSRTCRCYCKYCAFATHQPHLYAPEEVEAILDRAVKRHRVKELLVLTGERPEVNEVVAQRLAEYGHRDFISYVTW